VCAYSNTYATNDVLSGIDVVLRVVAKTSVWCDASKQDKDDCDDESECDQLAEDGSVGAKLCPSSATLLDVWLHFLLAKLVVKHAHDSNAVAEYLETGKLGSPDEDRCGNEKDILEYTAECKDETRGFANLEIRS